MYKDYEQMPPRPDGWGSGPSIEYRGFTITNRFETELGDFNSLQQAKNAIDASLAMKKLQDKGAALKRLWGSCELENGAERREYEENQINNHFENELYEREF